MGILPVILCFSIQAGCLCYPLECRIQLVRTETVIRVLILLFFLPLNFPKLEI